MPTYDYRCRSCGTELEVQQSFTDDPLTECPECQGELRKVFSAVGISFKGSGFYKTDSRGKSSSTSSAASAGDTSSASSSESTSSTGSTSSSDSASSSESTSSSESSKPSTTPAPSTSDSAV